MNFNVDIRRGVYTAMPREKQVYEQVVEVFRKAGCPIEESWGKHTGSEFIGWSDCEVFDERLVNCDNENSVEFMFGKSCQYISLFRILAMKDAPEPDIFTNTGKIPEEVSRWFEVGGRGWVLKNNRRFAVVFRDGYFRLETDKKSQRKDCYSNLLVALLFLIAEYKKDVLNVAEIIDNDFGKYLQQLEMKY